MENFYELGNSLIEIDRNVFELLEISHGENYEILGKVFLVPSKRQNNPKYKVFSSSKIYISKRKIGFSVNNKLSKKDNYRRFEVLLFLIHLKLNLQQSIISLHASAIQIEDTLCIFMGPKESGKSTTAVVLNQLGYPIVSNDYLEIQLQNDQMKFIRGDVYKQISFRKHALYQLEKEKYKIVDTSEEEIFKMKLKNLSKKEIFSNVIFVFPNLTNNDKLESHLLKNVKKRTKLYQQLSYYYRNTEVLFLNESLLSSEMIPDGFLINEFNHSKILSTLDKVCGYKTYEFYGDPKDIANYLIKVVKEIE